MKSWLCNGPKPALAAFQLIIDPFDIAPFDCAALRSLRQAPLWDRQDRFESFNFFFARHLHRPLQVAKQNEAERTGSGATRKRRLTGAGCYNSIFIHTNNSLLIRLAIASEGRPFSKCKIERKNNIRNGYDHQKAQCT